MEGTEVGFRLNSIGEVLEMSGSLAKKVDCLDGGMGRGGKVGLIRFVKDGSCPRGEGI